MAAAQSLTGPAQISPSAAQILGSSRRSRTRFFHVPPDPSGRDSTPPLRGISNLRFLCLYTLPSLLAITAAETQTKQESSLSLLSRTHCERRKGAMTELFDTAVTSFLHLPEVLERLAAADGERRSAGDHAHHATHGHRQARAHVDGGGGDSPVDIVETPGEYAFLLDVPGLSKSDIQVTLEDDRVLVMKSANGAGKRKREDEEEGECRYIRLERRAAPRSFVRRFRLPEDADTGGIAARCENGVLTVTIKKRPPPEKKTKSVQVTIG